MGFRGILPWTRVAGGDYSQPLTTMSEESVYGYFWTSSLMESF